MKPSHLLKVTPDSKQYYYLRLNDEQKKTYECISKGMKSLATVIEVPKHPINELSLVFESVLLDNPLLFYVSAFNHASDLYKGKSLIRPNYKYSKQLARDMTQKVTEHLHEFDQYMQMSDLEKELAVHDHCLKNFEYDYVFDEYSFSILGPVLNQKAACEGIAKYVKLTLDYLNVENVVVFGKATNPTDGSKPERHAWNIVYLAGIPYHLDVTFDMTIKNRMNRYDYFNLPDSEIKKEHTMINTVPVCSTHGNDYYSQNRMVVSSPRELGSYIAQRLQKGERDIVVKLRDVSDPDNIADKVLSIAQQQYASVVKKSFMVNCSYNPSQLVFELNFG